MNADCIARFIAEDVGPELLVYLQRLGLIRQLPLQRLANQAQGIGNLIQGGNPNLYIAIAPAADSSDVCGHTLGIVQLREGHVEAEAEPLGLGNHVDKVGFGLVGDVELEDFLADIGIQAADAGIEGIENRSDHWAGQLGMVRQGVWGSLAARTSRLIGQTLLLAELGSRPYLRAASRVW